MGITSEQQKTANAMFSPSRVMALFDSDEEGNLIVSETRHERTETSALPEMVKGPRTRDSKTKRDTAEDKKEQTKKAAAIKLANLRELALFFTSTSDKTKEKYEFSGLYAQCPWMRLCLHDLYQGGCYCFTKLGRPHVGIDCSQQSLSGGVVSLQWRHPQIAHK